MLKKLRYVFLSLYLTAMLILTACSGSESTSHNTNIVKTYSTASPIAVPPAPGGCCQ